MAKLLNCSVRSVYYHIESGNINAVNLGQRITRVKRSEIDNLFEQSKSLNDKTQSKLEPVKYDIVDCYNLVEVQLKYGISDSALRQLIKRNQIPKIKDGWIVYVPKEHIDKLLN